MQRIALDHSQNKQPHLRHIIQVAAMKESQALVGMRGTRLAVMCTLSSSWHVCVIGMSMLIYVSLFQFKYFMGHAA